MNYFAFIIQFALVAALSIRADAQESVSSSLSDNMKIAILIGGVLIVAIFMKKKFN